MHLYALLLTLGGPSRPTPDPLGLNAGRDTFDCEYLIFRQNFIIVLLVAILVTASLDPPVSTNGFRVQADHHSSTNSPSPPTQGSKSAQNCSENNGIFHPQNQVQSFTSLNFKDFLGAFSGRFREASACLRTIEIFRTA